MSNRHRYGWVPDHPDQRDQVYCIPRRARYAAIPPKASLRQDWPGIVDQGNLGSCVWNAVGYAFLWCLSKQSDVIFQPSRLFGYYNTRKLEGTVREDAGCMIRDAFKVLRKQGVCDETEWPYLISRYAVKPPSRCYDAAMENQSLQYFRVPLSESLLCQCVAEGFPVVIGIAIYESFETEDVARTGRVRLPKKTERLLGGHAVTVIGYDRDKERFELANSWGTGWGDHGFFTVPFDYLTDAELAADAWTLRMVEGRKR